MSRYFFACSALPELSKDEAPKISFDDLYMLFDLNLSKSARSQVDLAKSWTDMTNLEALLYGVPLEIFGNLDQKQMEAELEMGLGFFDFVFEFRKHFDTPDEQKEHFSQLYFQFFKKMREVSQGFLKWYYTLLEEVLTVMAALRAKKIGRDIEKELTFMEAALPLREEAAVYGDAKTYDPSEPYAELKKIYEDNFDEPGVQHKQFLSFLFDRVEEKKEELSWGLDWLIAYLVQIRLVSKLYPPSSQTFDILEQISERAS